MSKCENIKKKIVILIDYDFLNKIENNLKILVHCAMHDQHCSINSRENTGF